MNILSIDIGGTGLKSSVIDEQGNLLTSRVRIETPHPSPPAVLVDALVNLVSQLTVEYECISVGFPGVVRQGRIITAPTLGKEVWKNFDLAGEMAKRLEKPARVLNDADMQGLAAISGNGIEMVITLGTGLGSALFSDGQLGPHLELAHHEFRKNQTYNEQLGNETLKKIGKKKWNRRVRQAIDQLRVLTTFDKLYIGGGNAEKITFELESDIKIISNEDGLRGGAWLWRPVTANTSDQSA
jgi:polyphosphate glucokinase